MESIGKTFTNFLSIIILIDTDGNKAKHISTPKENFAVSLYRIPSTY